MKTIWLLRRRYTASGGGERFAARLARTLALCGWHVRIASEDWPEAGDGHYTVVHVPTNSPAAFSRHWSDRLAPVAEGVVFSLERTARQDLFRAGDGVHAAWLERRAPFRSPLGRLGTRLNPRHLSVKRLERETFHPAHTGRIIANSPMVRGEILARFNYPADRIEVIPSGVDLDLFAPCRDAGRREALRDRFGVPRDAVAWVFVGSGFARKGLLPAIRIAAALRAPPPWLLVLGKGSTGAARRLAERVGLASRLVFLPAGTPALDAYHAADAFILPTIYDPCSNATLEAAACGLPVITTPGNGAAAYVRATVLDDLDDPAAAAALCSHAAQPFDPARVDEVARAHLDEKPCWDATIRLVEQAAAKA